MLENEILADTAQSDWLRTALRAAIQCDPIRAANDAEFLGCILRLRAIRMTEQQELREDPREQSAASSSVVIDFPVPFAEAAG